MRSRTLSRIAPLALSLAFIPLACADDPTALDAGEPTFKKVPAGLTVSMAGDFRGAEQVLGGKNDQRTLALKGDYTLMLALDLESLECGDLPGTIPDEPGLVAYVQGQTPRVGALDIKYDKTEPDAGRVDSWTTTIGDYDYRVQFFRWGSAGFTDGPDGTVVSYRGGSIEVFKMNRRKYISREQCFGAFVDYDLTVR
ncbi:MAG: hypothetical protein PVH40_00905 [Gemmatimonadales bacterium]|jgi:hypothetical protein